MATSGVVHYVNPLTLEAELFLRSMQNLSSVQNKMDDTLFSTLERIVYSIEMFLEKQLPPIVNTDNTKLIKANELQTIERIFHCTKCRMDLGKSLDKAATHLINQHRSEERMQRKAAAEKRAAKLGSLPKKAKALIKNDLQKFFGETLQIAETLRQIPMYDDIERELFAVIKPHFPNDTIKLYKFGSRIAGIGTRNSDLDIFIDIGNTFHMFENRASEQTLQNLKTTRNALKMFPKAWTQLVAIDTARVPIIRVTNAKIGIKCDIGFSNSLGYCNTILTQYLFDLQPMMRRICIFLKKWLERTKLNEQLSTYAIILMTIFYFQMLNFLPSIESLQKDLQNHVKVGPWISNFLEKSGSELKIEKIELTPSNNKIFIQGFFQFYAKFDFTVNAVCPYYGRPIAIKGFEEAMPEHYKNYIKSNEDLKEIHVELNKQMIVQDPIQLNHNVVKAISPVVYKQIIHYFKQSDEVFKE